MDAGLKETDHPFEIYKGAELFIYGRYSGLTHYDRAPFTRYMGAIRGVLGRQAKNQNLELNPATEASAGCVFLN